MEKTPSRRERMVGGSLIVAELAVQQAGFGLTSNLAALAAAGTLSIVGSLALFGYVSARHGLRIREWDRAMWSAVLSAAFSNTLIGFASVFAVRHLGLGPVASVGALGVLSVGFLGILRCLGKEEPAVDRAWARKQLGLRALALAGVVVVSEPWKGLGHLDWVGFAWAAVSAWCFWNYIKRVFGPLSERKRTKEGLAVANLMSAPFVFVIVYLFGGWAEMSWHLLWVAGLAGLLALSIPVLLQDRAAAFGLRARETGVLYCLDTPLAAAIGAVGAALGLLSATQMPTVSALIGIVPVVYASIRVTLIGDKPSSAT